VKAEEMAGSGGVVTATSRSSRSVCPI